MKKFLTAIFIFVFCSYLTAQQGIKYTVDTIEFHANIDSTNRTTYKQLKLDWEGGYGNKWFTGGQYSLYVYPDTAKSAASTVLTGTTVADSDSLFIYVKERVPTTTTTGTDTWIENIEVHNDSTFITPNSGTTGLNFDLDWWYRFDFDLGRSRGVDIFVKLQDGTGSLGFRFVLTK